MPRNGSGTYTLPAGNPVVSNTTIRTSWANPTMSDIAVAITQSLARDGQTAPTANLPMAGFRHTGVGPAAAATDYAAASQVQDGSILRCTAESQAVDDYTAQLPYGLTAFVNGQVIVLKFPAANVGSAPTLNINSSFAWPILRQDGTAPLPGDCVGGVPTQLVWNDTAWLLLGVRSMGAVVAGVASFNTRTGAVVLTTADITAVQAYIPVNKAGDTMGGLLSLSANASLAMHATPLQQVNGLINSAISGIGTGVVSWNGRGGAVVMNAADVQAALGYVAANKAGEAFAGAVSAPTLTAVGAVGGATVTATGAVMGASVTATGAVTAKQHTQTPNINTTATGSLALDYANGQSQQLTLTGALAISAINNVPVGNIMRITFLATNVGAITLPAAVKWPLAGAAPDFTAGPLKQAVLVLESVTGGNLLANAAVY